MTNEHRRKVNELAREYLAKGDPTGWFEVLYASAKDDDGVIPWADMAPNRSFAEWAERENLKGAGQTALVIGCGLGDDAEELARCDFAVTAFDISPTAIEWCLKRWPQTNVNYVTADLFALPEDWTQQFDFVLEIYTIQALPVTVRQQAVQCVAQTVAPGGRLLVIGRLVDEGVERTGVPWPLTRLELDAFKAHLAEHRLEVFADGEGVQRFRAHYARQT